MALIGVEAADAHSEEEAQRLAVRFGVPVLNQPQPAGTPGVKLVVGPGGLALGFADKKRGKPFLIDFQNAVWRGHFQKPLGRNHIFRRALGVAPGESLKLLDATAGFAQDAMLSLSLGCEVTAVERSPVVAALIEDAVARAGREDQWWRERLARFKIVAADALEYLPAHAAPDVVYIDPMFSKPKSSAKSPKEMQLLQELLDGAPSGEAELLAAAQKVARRRVVVKRPLKARASLEPSHSYKGQSVRYDVYLRS